MKKFLEMLTEEMQQAFTAAGYDGSLGKVMLSNRPDCANISVTAPWREQSCIKKPPS